MSTREQDDSESKRTRLTIYVIVAVISLVLVGGIIYLAKRPVASNAEQAKLQGALRQGSPEFEKYKSQITVDKPEATEGARVVGDIQMRLVTSVRNFTGRTIDGLEMRGAVVDIEGNVVKERTIIAIPNLVRGVQELDPNKVLEVPIVLDGMSKEADRANITMEVTAIRFK